MIDFTTLDFTSVIHFTTLDFARQQLENADAFDEAAVLSGESSPHLCAARTRIDSR